MTLLEHLKAARAKIATPKSWAKHFSALGPNGNFISARDPQACQWCAIGALVATAPPGGIKGYDWYAVDAATDLLTKHSGSLWIADFNDARSTHHADVLAVFDRAIAAEEARAAA